MVNAVSSVNQSGGYGSIQRLCTDKNNRVIYSVKDADGNVAGNMSVAAQDVDRFEKAYHDVMETAPKIQEYAATHSSEEALVKRKITSAAAIGTGGLAGLILPLVLMKNTAAWKKVLTTIGTTLVGLAGGIAASIALTTPSGVFKFTKAAKTLSNIDIQPVNDIGACRATRM